MSSQEVLKTYHIPPFQSSGSKTMPAAVAIYPPLGQVTQIFGRIVSFTAILDVDSDETDDSWEVALWHSTSAGDVASWQETLLAPSTGPKANVSSLQSNGSKKRRLQYTGSFSPGKALNFTVKYRSNAGQPWIWARDAGGLADGQVIVTGDMAGAQLPEKLENIFKDLNPDLVIKSVASQAPQTKLWSLEAAVPGAQGEESAIVNVPLGVPWNGEYVRWFALVRPWTPWLAPRQGKSNFDIDRDGVLCSFLSPEGAHLVILAVSGLDNVTPVLQSRDSGAVSIKIRNDNEARLNATILVAVGQEFESANAAVMYQARALAAANAPGAQGSNAFESQPPVIPQPSHPVVADESHDNTIGSKNGDVKADWYEEWFDGLGFCTWNALGQQLTDEKVIDAVDQLSKNNIKISTLILDDNWQDIQYSESGQWQNSWNDFEAEPNTFPKGLKTTVNFIRLRYPHIKHVAVWHALLGYWGGISRKGNLAKKYKTVEVMREDGERRNIPWGGAIRVVAESDVRKFYDDFYTFLSQSGVDGVKTDGQFMIDLFVSAKVRRELIYNYLSAWTTASLRHFSMRSISCMSQIPQAIFHSHLPRNRPVMLCRNSDDFYPGIPESHPWHIWSNAHNSLLTQHLNILPDWDMFQTVHDYSGFHAAARCVSGGPIYITDEPGKYNLDLIRQMTAATVTGNTVILRPSVLGRSVDQYNEYNDNVLLKVGSYHGWAATGTPIMGVFNVSNKALAELIPLSRFMGIVPSLNYVVRSHDTGLLSPPIRTDSQGGLLAVTLDVRGYDVMTAYPLSVFDTDSRGRVYVANLGLVGKLSGAAAIMSTTYTLQTTGRLVVSARLKALGTWGLYISSLPDMSIGDDFLITMYDLAIPRRTVSISKTDVHVLEVDVEAAWKELGLRPGWSNEVEVKLFCNLDSEDYVLISPQPK